MKTLKQLWDALLFGLGFWFAAKVLEWLTRLMHSIIT